MTWKLELVSSNGGEPTRVFVGELGEIGAPETLDGVGLPHRTAQALLAQLQRRVVSVQEEALKRKAEDMRRLDPSLRLKDYRVRSAQTLHGALRIRVPRLTRVGASFPAPSLLTGSGRCSAAYAALLARLGSWMSFRDASALAATFFPEASGASVASVRRRVGDAAERLSLEAPEAERPAAAAIDVGIGTTFVRSCDDDGPRHHAALIGVATAGDGRTRRIGGVIAAVEHPHALVDEALSSLGRTKATRVTAFTDGDRMLRGYLSRAGVEARPILDWPHIARRVHAAKTTATGLKALTEREKRARPVIQQLLDSLHWRLWNGQTDRAREAFTQIERRLDAFDIRRIRPGRTAAPARRLLRAVKALRDYVESQSTYLVDYAARQRRGETISTATSESLANALVNRRMDKRQQMRWSAAGAHAVVAVRTALRNECATANQHNAPALAA